MDESEFNLSVLENVTTFASPLKDSADYEAIFGLIKEEIDINTEDETESQKAGKRPYLGTKRKDSETCNSERILFKSPYKRSYTLRLKSPGSLLKKRRTDEWLRNERASVEKEPYSRRARSLGALKPGRSFQTNFRKYRSPASHSSETSSFSDFCDNSVVETANMITENDDNTESEAEEKSPIVDETAAAILGDESTAITSRDKTASLAPDDSLSRATITDDDFVESSQSTTSSDLRKKLLSRRSTVENNNSAAATKTIDTERTNGIAESEEESQNFSLIFSSESMSRGGSDTRESSQSPSRSRKRKATPISPINVSTPKQQKLIDSTMETSLKSQLSEQRKTIAASPLKGLSQELENCLNNSDYEQMSEDLQTDMFERTSFTFETIELLNQYEDTNQRTNNRILSKILSSPATKIDEESLHGMDMVADKVLPTEDPLYIEENGKNIASAGSLNVKMSCDKVLEENEKISIVAKNLSVKPIRRSTRKCLVEEIVTNENIDPLTSERKQSVGKVTKGRTTRKSNLMEKSVVAKRRSTRKCLVEESNETNENTVPSKLEDKKRANEVNKEFTRKSIRIDKTERAKERRNSARLRTNDMKKLDLSELEDDEDLAVEAADISKKVEAAEKKAALSEKTRKKLDKLVIRLRNKVLPQHKIESRAGSKPLSYKQQKQFLRLAPLSKATYNPAEDEKIKANWKAFCEDHNWNPKDYKPFLNLKHGDKLIMSSLKERRKFVQFLTDGLPNRPLCSVYNRFKILYGKHPNSGSRYTTEEDMKILAYMLHKPAENPDRKCSELAMVLDRTRESIWKRYKKLAKKYCRQDEKKVLTKVEWDLPLTEEFITTLLDITLSEDLMELKDAFIPMVVWTKMEEKMEIEHQLMKRFWEQQLHLQLFSAEPLYLNKIKVMLIEHMYTKQFWHPAEIKWQQVVRYFDGLTISFLRKVFNHLTMKISTKLRSRNLKNILEWLYTKKIDQLIKEPNDKCLPRIFYKNKKAEILREDIERIQSYSESLDID